MGHFLGAEIKIKNIAQIIAAQNTKHLKFLKLTEREEAARESEKEQYILIDSVNNVEKPRKENISKRE